MKNSSVFLTGCLALFLIIPVYSCSPGSVKVESDTLGQKIHSMEELQSDFRQFREFLEESHPRMYQFTTKTEFDSLFEVHYRMINHPMNTQEFYAVLVPLIARIGCGHSSLWTPDGYWESAPNQMFPLGVMARDGKLFLIHDYGLDLGLTTGSQILSVNGRRTAEIVDEMTGNIWSDGFIYTKRYRRLNSVFPWLYALNYGFPEQFNLDILENGMERNITLNSLRREIIEDYNDSVNMSGQGSRPRLWMDLLDGQTALLTIRSFSYYREVNKFHKFVDSCFQVIKDNNVQHLIIDLRGNSGGDPYCSTHLMRYIQKEPIVYFQYPYRGYPDFSKPLPMIKNNFSGKQFYLIDGMCFSTTGHITALMKYHNLGTFIGEETGATFSCNDASHDVFLKHTGYRVQSARRTYAAAVSGLPLNRGILPDHPVRQSITEVIDGHDAVLEYTLDLISALTPGQE